MALNQSSRPEEDHFCRAAYEGFLAEKYANFNLLWGIFCLTLVVVCTFSWLKFNRRAYLWVRPTSAMLITTLGFISYVLGFPLWRSQLDYEESFLTRCGTTTFFRFSAVFLYTCDLFVRFISCYYKHKLLEIVVQTYAKSSTGANVQSQSSREQLLIQYYKRRCSPQFLPKVALVGLVASMIASIMLSILICPNFGIVKDCNFTRYANIFNGFAAFGFIFVLTGVSLLLPLRKGRPDMFGLYWEIIANLIGFAVLYIPSLFFFAVGATETPDDAEDVIKMDNEIVHDFVFVFHYILMVVYPLYIALRYRDSHFSLKLSDVIEHPNGKALFEQHMKSEFSDRHLACYFLIQRWKEDYKANPNPDLRDTVARNIFEVYIKLGAEREVNISGHLRTELLENLHRANRDVFDDVQAAIYEVMERDPFYRFKIFGLFKFYVGLSNSPDDNPTTTLLEDSIAMRECCC